MTLRTALMIAGDSEGAKRALAEMDAALERGEKQALEYNAAYERTDATIKMLANAQALAKSEIDQSRAAFAAGKITQEDYNREILETKTALGLVQAEYRRSSAELTKHSQNLNATTEMTNAQRAGAQQLAFQVGDMATMFSMGARPMQIFASQGTQVVQAIGMMRGGAGGLIGFLGGPWGLGIMAAVTALTPFISKLFESDKAIDTVAQSLRDMETDADRAVAALQRLDGQRQTSLEGDIILAEIERDKMQRRLGEMQDRPALPEGGGFGDERSQARRAAIRRQRSEEERQLQWDLVELQGRIDIGRDALRRMQEKEDAKPAERDVAARPSVSRQTGSTGTAGRISEEARALEAANDNTKQYIASLQDEIEAIGLDEKALRQLEIQRAKEAAVTDDQRASIDDLNQKREEAIALEESRQRAGAIRDETKGTETSIASLEREAQAIGLVGWARERLLMRLEQQAQMDALLAQLSRAKVSGTQEEIDALLAQIDALQTKNALETQIGDASEVHREQAEAAERNAESYRHLGRSAAGALSQILIYGEGAGGVMKRLATSIADAILQANLLGEGPLAGIFGGGGGAGGLIGSLLGAIGFGGGRASGGPVSPGQIYAVNERSTAPGFFLPVGPGRIEPPSNDNPAVGSRGAEAAPVYFDLRGAVLTKDLLRQMNRIARSTSGGMIGRYDSELPERIDSQAARFR